LGSIGVQLVIEFEDEDCLWYLDANLIEGLLANVLTNSIRYTKSILNFQIKVIDGWLNIRMLDDGDGFPDNMLSLLDQPESVCFQSGATGLGLFFCQKIAALHTEGERQGYVKLSNNSATGGAVFDLFLP